MISNSHSQTGVSAETTRLYHLGFRQTVNEPSLSRATGSGCFENIGKECVIASRTKSKATNICRLTAIYKPDSYLK